MKRCRIDIQCQALYSSGKRCKKKARYSMQYHGDGELYDYNDPVPGWVVVYLCKEHVEVK